MAEHIFYTIGPPLVDMSIDMRVYIDGGMLVIDVDTDMGGFGTPGLLVPNGTFVKIGLVDGKIVISAVDQMPSTAPSEK